MVTKLVSANSIASIFLGELRDLSIQKDPFRFRTNLRRLGHILGYEVSKMFSYESRTIRTPLGEFDGVKIENKLVIATILRAGLPLHEGVLDCFDYAENAFITAYRKYSKSGDFEIKLEYVASPNLNGKTLILCDPMLATGASILGTLKELKTYGTPKQIYILGIIASRDAIETIQLYDSSLHIIVGDIDEELTAKGYIVPGLGDAGDLAYGKKTDQ
jgi:uracil phosphoribosyltransferase